MGKTLYKPNNAMSDSTAVFTIEASEVEFPCQSLQQNSRYFSLSLPLLPPSLKYQIALPPWVTLPSLLSILRYFETGLIEYCDIYSAQRVLWLAELFECAEMREKLIEKVIAPMINRENVLLFLQEAEEKERIGNWNVLKGKCVEVAQRNADYLYKYYGKAMQRLPSSLVETVIRGYFLLKNSENTSKNDFSEMLKSLLNASPYAHFLSLLSSERTSLSPINLIQTLSIPILPDAESTYTSPEFLFGNTRWTVSAVVSAVAGTLQVLLQGMGPEGEGNGIEAVVVCGEIVGKAKSTPEVVITVGKRKGENWLLLEIDIGEKEEETTLIVNLWGAYAGLYSSLLTYIGNSAQSLLATEPLSSLSTRDLISLLQYRYLSVQSEDFVLEMLAKWSSEVLFPPDIAQLLHYIRWTYVTTSALLTLFMRYPRLKRVKNWRKSIQKEIEQRALGPRISEEIPYKKASKPRKSYSDQTVGQVYGQMSEFLRDVEKTLWDMGEKARNGLESRKWDAYMREMHDKDREIEKLRKRKDELSEERKKGE